MGEDETTPAQVECTEPRCVAYQGTHSVPNPADPDWKHERPPIETDFFYIQLEKYVFDTEWMVDVEVGKPHLTSDRAAELITALSVALAECRALNEQDPGGDRRRGSN